MTEELQAELNKNLAQIEDYTLTEEKILKGKETIAEKLKEAINDNIDLTEEDKQIIDAELNNIKTSNSKDEIMLSISKIRDVLAKYLKGLKEVEKQPDKEEHDKQETNEQEEIQQQENNQEEVTQEQINQEENNQNGEEEQEVNEDVEQELEPEESFDTDKIDSLSEDLQIAQDANYISKITAKRGRLIREIQREIAKIKKSDITDAKTIEVLDKLETRLRTEIDNHKEQLNDRYRDEFKKQKATVPAILTVLPKGVALQVQKVDTCIRELISAKTLKQKIAAGVNIAKSLGMVAATPIIFTAKFIARHWYLVLLLLSLLKAPNFKLNDKKDNNDEFDKDPGVEREYVVDNAFDKQYGFDTSPVGEPALELNLGAQRLQEFAKNNASTSQTVGTPETDAMMEKLKVDANQYDLGAQQLQEFVKNNASTAQTVGTPETDAMMDKIKVDANQYDLGAQQLQEFAKNNASTGSVSAPSVETAKNVDLPRASNLAPSLETVKVPSIAELEKQRLGNGLDFDPTIPPEVSQIIDSHSEEFKHIMFEFANGLEKNYNFFIGEWHKDVKVVHSAEEFTEAVEDLIGAKLNFADAKRVYLSGVDLPAADRTIIWPELEQETAGIIPVRYFETYGDLMNYVMSGEDKYLTGYYNEFAENYGKDFDININSSETFVETIANFLGVSTGTAGTLFLLYELAQYGLAIPTGGASLALPG